MHKIYSNKISILLLILPALLLFIVFIPISTAFIVGSSFFKWELLTPPIYKGLDNYKYLFTNDSIFWIGFRNNLIWIVGNVFLVLVPSFFLALILNAKMIGKNFFRSVIFLPVCLSSTAVGLIWYFVYHYKIGILNYLIRFIGFENFQHAWLNSEKTALYAVILTISWQWVGYYMVLYLSGLAMIPDELIEAARIDGANSRQVLWNITIPFLKPIFKITSVLAVVNAFKGFDLMYIMTQGGPNRSTYLLALHMFDTSFGRMQYGYGSAIAVVIILLCVVSTLLINKFFSRDNMDA